jgi:hypothetical protein
MSRSESADSPADEIRADIEHTRAELADTVDALTGKLDVKGRASDKIADAKTKAGTAARTATEQVRPYGKQILLGTLAAAVVLVVVRKWRG